MIKTDEIIRMMSKRNWDYTNGILSFEIGRGVMLPYFSIPDLEEFIKMKNESNLLRGKKENPIETLAKSLKPYL